MTAMHNTMQKMMERVQTPWTTRLIGALLALGITVAHVGDQGGITAFNDDPDWLGWGYRLIEVGGLATAAVLLLIGGIRLAWAPAAVLGLVPFISYILTRTTGLPGHHDDVGNWSDWSGTMALLIEASLFVLAVSVLLARRSTPLVSAPVAPATQAVPSLR
jgi:hypothetical protein